MPAIQYYRVPDNAAIYRCKFCGNEMVQNGGAWDDADNPLTWEDTGICQGLSTGGVHSPW